MNWSTELVALVPPAVVTVISMVPAVPAGEEATICVAVSLVMAAVLLPKLTAVALLRSVPLMVTLVPPAVVPELGEILVTVGPVT